MKRLLVVSDFISGSGMTNVVFNVFSRFPKDEYQIDAIGYGIDNSAYTDKKSDKLGWRFERVIPVTQNPIKHWIWWKNWFKHHSYDIVYFNYSSSWNFLPLVYARQYGHVKMIACHSHNSYFSHKFSNPLMMQALSILNDYGRKVFAKQSDIKIATSKEAAQWMFGKSYVDNTHISLNGIDINKFSFNLNTRKQLRQTLNINDETKLMGFVGVLQERKQPLFALQVFNIYHQINPNSKLVMFGKGHLNEAISQYIENHNLQKYVYRRDFVDNVNEWYSAMDLLLFTSKYEGLPLVALEAQMSGLQILASDTNPDLVFASNAIHRMKNFDVKEWCQKINELLGTENSQRALDPNLKKFSVDRQASMIRSLLNKS